MRWINKSRRLLAVHYFIKISMEKGVVHIKPTNQPVARNNTKNSLDSRPLDNRTEDLIIINAMLLRETTDNPSSLMTRKEPSE